MPVWEYKESNLGGLPESDIKTDYIGRLVPLARAVWLREDLKTAEIANGLRYGVFADSKEQKTKKIKPGTGIREPTASIELDKRDPSKYRLVSASAGDGVPKAVWRELHSVALLRRSAKRGGPIALEHFSTAETKEAVLWCGALVGDQAKVGDVIESVFRLPKQFLEDAATGLNDDPRKQPGPNQTYRQGVDFADHWASRLGDAVYTYRMKLADREGAKKTKNQAAMRFWTVMEQQAERVLLHDVAVNSGKYWKAEGDWMAQSPWGLEVRKATHEAYNFSCPHSTSRQLRAYAAGLGVLRGENKKKSPASRETDDGNEPTEGAE